VSRNKSLDAVENDPDKFVVRLENDRVRVLEARISPGSRHEMHSHPEHIVYALTSYTVKDTFPDGSSSTASRKAGEVHWGEAITHEAENVGDILVHALIIEFKK
jgi:hypothetical protein